MKKKVKGLTLSKETLRHLQSEQLEIVQGARTGASDCPAHCKTITGSTVGSELPCA